MNFTAPQAVATHSEAGHSVVSTTTVVLKRLWRTWLDKRAQRAVDNHLKLLSDELLRDVGLTRDQIGSAAQGREIRAKISRYY